MAEESQCIVVQEENKICSVKKCERISNENMDICLFHYKGRLATKKILRNT